MLAESKRLEKEINKLNSEIKNLPEGKLVCTKNGNSFKWYVSINKQLTYILKKNKSYAGKTFSKLHTYSKYGIIPTINLITTYETGDNPLDLDAVQKNIEQYFL